MAPISASNRPDGALPLPDTSPVAMLFAEVNALAIRLRQRGRPLAGGLSELPSAEHSVLEIINRFGAMTVPQIARERSTSRQNIQVLVDRLMSQGAVELSSNPVHKRSALVQLTQKGHLTLDAGTEVQKELLSEIEAGLSQPEISATVAVLRRIQAQLSSETEADSAQHSPQSKEVGLERAKPMPAIEVEIEEQEFPLNLL